MTDPGTRQSAAAGGFVGRVEELGRLAGILDDPSPSCSGALVAGEPGIGKTRLLEKLATCAAAQGWRVVWGRAWHDDGAPPYWLWTQVVRDLRDLPLGTDLATVVLDEPEDLGRFELFDATAGLIRRSATTRPVVILLDDLHAADVPSLLLTRFIVQQLAGTRARVVGAHRLDPAAPDEVRVHLEALARSGTELRLDGLDLDSVSELVGDRTRSLDVHEVTGGNPLFVEQVLRLHPAAVHDDGTEPGSTAALRAAITMRIGALAQRPRETLTGIAVLGGTVDVDDLADLVDADRASIEADLDALAAAGLATRPVATAGHRVHALVAETAVADDEARHVVAALHHRAAALVGTGPERAGARARHLLQAGPEHRDEAVGACLRAAQVATAATAYEDAAAHCARALAALDAEPPTGSPHIDRLRLDGLLDLGRMLRIIDQVDAADDAFERAGALAESLGDPEASARAALRGGVQYYFAADLHAPLADRCRAALAGLPPGDSPLRARLLADLASRSQPGPEAGRDLADEAVAMARRTGDPAALGSALVAQQRTALGPATLARRLATAHEVLALARTAHEPMLAVQGRYLLLGAAIERGDLRGMDGELASESTPLDHLADRHRARLSRWFQHVRATFDGDIEHAEQTAERGLTESLEHGDPAAWRIYGAQLGVIRWLQDRSLEMEPLFEAQHRADPDESVWTAALTYLWAANGRHDEARVTAAAIDLDAVPEGMHWLLTMVLLAEAAVALEDDPLAAALAERLLPFADRFVPINVGAAAWGTVARPLALIARQAGQVDAAIEYLTRAIDVCVRLGARPWLAQVQLDLADTLVGTGRTNDPRIPVLCTEASAAVDRLGLVRFVEQARALRDLVEDLPSAGTKPAGPSRPTVSVLGTFEVVSSDGELARWTSRKARELLKILVARRGSPVHREVLMDLLWPGIEPSVLGNRLSVALSTVRRALDPAHASPTGDLIAADRSTVRLRTDRIEVDVEQFLGAADEALAAHDADRGDAVHLLASTIRSHRGPAFPDEPYAEWAAPLRSEVWATHLRVARALADRAAGAGDDLMAMDALRRIVDADPSDEQSRRRLAGTLDRLGVPERLAESLGIGAD